MTHSNPCRTNLGSRRGIIGSDEKWSGLVRSDGALCKYSRREEGMRIKADSPPFFIHSNYPRCCTYIARIYPMKSCLTPGSIEEDQIPPGRLQHSFNNIDRGGGGSFWAVNWVRGWAVRNFGAGFVKNTMLDIFTLPPGASSKVLNLTP